MSICEKTRYKHTPKSNIPVPRNIACVGKFATAILMIKDIIGVTAAPIAFIIDADLDKYFSSISDTNSTLIKEDNNDTKMPSNKQATTVKPYLKKT